MAGSLRSVEALTIHPSSSRVFFQVVQQWREVRQPSSPCPGSAMGRGTDKCGHPCPIQEWDLSSEKPGLSRGGRKGSLEGEGVGDTKQELQAVDALTRRAAPGARLWVSSRFSCPSPGFASTLFRMVLHDPTLQHISCILLELEGEKSRIRDGGLHLLLLLWIQSPCTGDFCWVPSCNDFSIHFSAWDSCTLFFVIAWPPPSALSLSLCCFSALCPLPSMEGLDGLFRFGPSPGVPFLGAGSACLCREPLLSYISSH